jgi:hypothetical protein
MMPIVPRIAMAIIVKRPFASSVIMPVLYLTKFFKTKLAGVNQPAQKNVYTSGPTVFLFVCILFLGHVLFSEKCEL